MSCPEGSTLNTETKMCTMPPQMTCPVGYTLVNGMCQPQESAPPAEPVLPEPPSEPVVSTGPIAPAGMEQPCPIGYEYRDSMCYPLPN